MEPSGLHTERTDLGMALNSHRLEASDGESSDSNSDYDDEAGEEEEADRWQANLESRLFGHFVMPDQ